MEKILIILRIIFFPVIVTGLFTLMAIKKHINVERIIEIDNYLSKENIKIDNSEDLFRKTYIHKVDISE